MQARNYELCEEIVRLFFTIPSPFKKLLCRLVNKLIQLELTYVKIWKKE